MDSNRTVQRLRSAYGVNVQAYIQPNHCESVDGIVSVKPRAAGNGT